MNHAKVAIVRAHARRVECLAPPAASVGFIVPRRGTHLTDAATLCKGLSRILPPGGGAMATLCHRPFAARRCS